MSLRRLSPCLILELDAIGRRIRVFEVLDFDFDALFSLNSAEELGPACGFDIEAPWSGIALGPDLG